jgi:5-methyltetrahydropteroyltriglutamate--homocysteine methyltransferase
VGAHSIPRWYEALDRMISLGQLAEGDFADAQLRATQAAILEQEVAGIDVITGGEMHRRRHNRHSPPNAMLNHFWLKIPSFQGETRPKPITDYDPNVFHPAAICRGPIPDDIDLGLVDEFNTVASLGALRQIMTQVDSAANGRDAADEDNRGHHQITDQR